MVRILILICISSSLFAQQGWEKIETFGPEAYLANTEDYFGSDVAMAFEYAVVGASGENRDAGAAYVLHYNGSEWSKVARLTPSDSKAGILFGSSVAIEYVSPNEQIVIIGAPKDGNGTVYVFRTPAEGWSNMTETTKIIPEESGEIGQFGSAVDISNSTVVVGASNPNNKGAAFIYENTSDDWSSLGQVAILHSDQTDDLFGSSLDIDDDVIVIGARFYHNVEQSAGSVFVFVKPSEGWVDMSHSARLSANSHFTAALFGISVSLDNDILVVGSLSDEKAFDDKGAIFLFQKPEAGWSDMTESLKLTAPLNDQESSSNYEFGSSVSIHQNQIAVGSTGNKEHNGAIYCYEIPDLDVVNTLFMGKVTRSSDSKALGSSVAIYANHLLAADKSSSNSGVGSGALISLELPATDWSIINESQLILPIPYEMNRSDRFGRSVKIDGDIAVVGSPNYNKSAGAAFIYEKGVNGWEKIAALSSDVDGDRFGEYIDISDNYIAVGSPDTVYVFSRDNENWDKVAQLATSEGVFITSLAMNDNTVVLGSTSGIVDGLSTGAAYVYSKVSNAEWTSGLEIAKIIASNGMSNDSFGATVDVYNDKTIAVGATSYSSYTGGVYIFEKGDGNWTNSAETALITPSDASPADGFGGSLEFQENMIVVGSPGRTEPNSPQYTGAVYLFTRSDESWVATNETKIEVTRLEGGESFGTSVSIEGSLIVAGNSPSVFNSNVSAKAYIFKEPEGGWVNQTNFEVIELGDDGKASSIDLSGNEIMMSHLVKAGIVHVYAFTDKADIDEFVLNSQVEKALIDSVSNTVAVDVFFNTDLTNIQPELKLTDGATSIPASGEAVDFSSGSVVYTVTNKTGTFSKEWEVSINPTSILGVSEEIKDNMRIYPNPSKDGKFQLFIDDNSKALRSVSVHNIFGQILMRAEVDSSNPRIDLSKHSNGVYFIQVNFGGKNFHIKVIKN